MTYEELFNESKELFIKLSKGELTPEEQLVFFQNVRQLVQLEETATEA